ncbi:MAG TPA: hypothetical protein PLK35_00475 [Candidatus Moranbacteria bacterium]|nr:hypothetical protein [Candidatus Moranbacteria bacterium]
MADQIIRISGQYRTYSWTRGLAPQRPVRSLEEEARRNPQAVIFRLLNEGREDEAENFFQRFVQ